ncbi:crotonyl-CoA carboxylase/reductase [Streptomyces sp. V4-01]|uniref:Crotonyl-CoA carboxylase/reductase n=1 Tax=Actinacidiphila polyblastidii TaxID=3110430 RepID=A0ABU7PLN8_9ACTN|nr:crotonyl-CoA carboxylase/reductase [Streptomyces sp. V4-01]
MDALSAAVLAGEPAERLAATPLPDTYLAAHLRAEDVGIFAGAADKDVRRSLRLGPVPMPRIAPDEVIVAVMASSINYNTVWSAMFEPIPTFEFLRRYGRQDAHAARHDLPHHVVGSDGAGVIVRVGSGVRRWRIGDRVVISPAHIDDQEPGTHGDGMMGAEQRAWGFETNFGALAHYCVARASQLLPKPAHMTWEEAACVPLCGGTAYRMLVGEHGARIKQGDVVLIWGATGGLGSYAVQLVKNGGGIPVGVVSSPERAAMLRRLGCDVVIDRSELGMGDAVQGGSAPGGTQAEDADRDIQAGKRLGRAIRAAVGEDPHVVFDYVGRATFGISVFVVRRGGTVVTCGSSTGFRHVYDNRYLWMNLKRIIGSHIANLQEMREFIRLVQLGRIGSAVSRVYPLAEVGEAARLVQSNAHLGKVGVLALAPERGLGVTDPALRASLGPERLAPLSGAGVAYAG